MARHAGTVLLLVALVLLAARAMAMDQRIADFEIALDAPARIEPRHRSPLACLGNCEEGFLFQAIPIQISIHDADLPAADVPNARLMQRALTGASNGALPIGGIINDLISVPVGGTLFSDQPNVVLERFVQLRVSERIDGRFVETRRYGINDLHELERTTGIWRWSEPNAAPPSRPAHGICRRWRNEDCTPFAALGDTSEWHAVAFYEPRRVPRAGADVTLKLELALATTTDRLVPSGVVGPGLPSLIKRTLDEDKRYTQYVKVHYGEAPLPSFGVGWHYGDLHYHSQGTDNDGETAYHFRGVLHAMSANGLDFAFATDHASNSPQIVSADLNLQSAELLRPVFRGLRDLSPDRFRFNHALVDGDDGAHQNVASFPRRTFDTALADKALSPFARPERRLVTPRLFLGAEVDVIPEIERVPGTVSPRSHRACTELPKALLCLNAGLGAAQCLNPLDEHPPDACDGDTLLTPVPGNRALVRDVQGPADGKLLSTSFFARQHLLYLPADGVSPDAFIPSNTSRYGGATRRLDDLLQDEFTDPRKRGFFFIAHPLSRSSGSGFGRVGPDVVPVSTLTARTAFASEHFLGLQFWNENTSRYTDVADREGESRDHRPNEDVPDPHTVDADDTFLGELIPVASLERWTHFNSTLAGRTRIGHGEALWDNLLLWGLDPIITRELDWLPAGTPRRVFAAGGSDAHGDFNFRREGYFIGLQRVTDTVFGTPRNLVFTGPPRGEEIVSGSLRGRALSQAQVTDALASGRYVVTDGPIVRLVYDADDDGRVGPGDGMMGSVSRHGDRCSVPIVVQWKSSEEFGPVDSVSLSVGVHSDTHAVPFVYRAWRRPPGAEPGDLGFDAADIGGTRTWSVPGSDRRYTSYGPGFGARTHYVNVMDPTDDLRLFIPVGADEGFEGQRRLEIDPRLLAVGALRESRQCPSAGATHQRWREVDRRQALGRSSVAVDARTLGEPPGREEGFLMRVDDTAPTHESDQRHFPELPACPLSRSFVDARVPDRLYVRATLVNAPAPGTARNCRDRPNVGELHDPRHSCVRRRAISNPVWITIAPHPGASGTCAAGGGGVVQ